MIDEKKLIEEIKDLRVSVIESDEDLDTYNKYTECVKDLIIQMIDEQPKINISKRMNNED